LIAEFHETFNSTQEGNTHSETDWYTQMILDARAKTGRFKKLGSCEVRRIDEPSYLTLDI